MAASVFQTGRGPQLNGLRVNSAPWRVHRIDFDQTISPSRNPCACTSFSFGIYFNNLNEISSCLNQDGIAVALLHGFVQHKGALDDTSVNGRPLREIRPDGYLELRDANNFYSGAGMVQQVRYKHLGHIQAAVHSKARSVPFKHNIEWLSLNIVTCYAGCCGELRH